MSTDFPSVRPSRPPTVPGSRDTRTLSVDLLTRVEGEGRFRLVFDADGRVEESFFSIFEAPRYFEGFLRGRSLYEVVDITARICGICPVAYQMSASNALEQALALRPGPYIGALRRLLYCGEWIHSHALHVFMLHLPDLFGCANVFELAERGYRDWVQRALAMKKVGNLLQEVIGGRAVHPVSVRVGGFYRAPDADRVRGLRPHLERGLEDAVAALEMLASLDLPALDDTYVYVALESSDGAYPLEEGRRIAITGRDPVPLEDFNDVFNEYQVPHSNALQCKLRDDGRAYLCGPAARFSHYRDRLHPEAIRALSGVKIPTALRNPHQAIVVRAVEMVHAFAEAIDLVDRYRPPEPAYVDAPARDAEGYGASEAPRGLLFHRYRVGADGLVKAAQIVPPTAQNQARIEADLVAGAPLLVEMDDTAAQAWCETLVRSYDPCISCATHAFRVEIVRPEPRQP